MGATVYLDIHMLFVHANQDGVETVVNLHRRIVTNNHVEVTEIALSQEMVTNAFANQDGKENSVTTTLMIVTQIRANTALASIWSMDSNVCVLKVGVEPFVIH